jgi:hypothetical protein
VSPLVPGVTQKKINATGSRSKHRGVESGLICNLWEAMGPWHRVPWP